MRTMAALSGVILGIASLWQAIVLWQQRTVLLDYGATQAVNGSIAMSLIWSCFLIVLGSLVWRRWLPSHVLLPVAFLVYTLYTVFWLSPSVPFILVMVFLTIFTGVGLNWANSAETTQFPEQHTN